MSFLAQLLVLDKAVTCSVSNGWQMVENIGEETVDEASHQQDERRRKGKAIKPPNEPCDHGRDADAPTKPYMTPPARIGRTSPDPVGRTMGHYQHDHKCDSREVGVLDNMFKRESLALGRQASKVPKNVPKEAPEEPKAQGKRKGAKGGKK